MSLFAPYVVHALEKSIVFNEIINKVVLFIHLYDQRNIDLQLCH